MLTNHLLYWFLLAIKEHNQNFKKKTRWVHTLGPTTSNNPTHGKSSAEKNRTLCMFNPGKKNARNGTTNHGICLNLMAQEKTVHQNSNIGANVLTLWFVFLVNPKKGFNSDNFRYFCNGHLLQHVQHQLHPEPQDLQAPSLSMSRVPPSESAATPWISATWQGPGGTKNGKKH